MSFTKSLTLKIKESLNNHFGRENYDEYRFGPYKESHEGWLEKLKWHIKRLINYRGINNPEKYLQSINYFQYEDALEKLYKILDEKSRNLLVQLIAYRALGFRKVKLPLNTPDYHRNLENIIALLDKNDFIQTTFLNTKIYKANLRSLGYNLDIYYTPTGILTDFVNEQYAYKNESGILLSAQSGDVVIDAGGCWGDTALYFADKVGKQGKVFSFEFIPNNIKIHQTNRSLNPQYDEVIELIPQPLSDKSNIEIFYKDLGPASKVELASFDGYTGSCKTITIDDFVEERSLDKVSFIKMDIEGAEPLALKGAINTIKKFRPKMAIAIYHSLDDMVNIPLWIHNLNLGYQLYIGHYKIHAEETVLFALP